VATAEFRGRTDVRQYWVLYLLLVAGLTAWCLLDVMPRGSINRQRIIEHRTDFTVYTEAGAAFFDGRDPYLVTNPRGWRYLYPPLFAILVSPLHALPSTGQVAVWFVVSALMAIGCYFEMRRLCDAIFGFAIRDEQHRRVLIIGFAALAAVLLPALNCMQRGQVEVLKLYLLLLGFRLFVTGRGPRAWFVAGLVFAGAGILKLTPLLPVACLILYDGVAGLWRPSAIVPRRRVASMSAGLGTGLVLFALLLPSAVIGWDANLHHLHSWFARVVTKVIDVRTSDFGEDVRSVRNQSLDNAAYRLGNWIYAKFADGPNDAIIDRPHQEHAWLPMDRPIAGGMIVAARVGGLLLLLLFTIHFALLDSRRGDGMPGRAVTFGLACAATLVVCPVARTTYFALFLPAIVFVSMSLLQAGRGRTAVFMAIVPVVAIWAHYLGLPGSGRIGLLGLTTATWFFCTCSILERCLAPSRAPSRAAESVANDPVLDQPRNAEIGLTLIAQRST
jgi:Glycosyltransferase family 87